MPRYIDAEREIKEIENVLDTKLAVGDDDHSIGFYALALFASMLRNAPTADVAPVIHAHWGVQRVTKSAKKGRTIPLILLSCSNCGQSNGRRISNFCPRCGAKMDEEKSDD